MIEDKKTQIITTKKKVKEDIKKLYFNNKNKSYALINIDNNILNSIIEGFKILPTNFLIIWKWIDSENIKFIENISDDLLLWIDFLITDNSTENIKKYTQNWICPIINSNHKLKELFSDFVAIDWIWNSFKYIDWNIWSMFYSLSRYLENYNFPYDNKNLVKNILLT